MKQYIYSIIFCALSASSMLTAQITKEKRAAKQYDDFAYVNAIESFTYLVNKGYNHIDIYKKLGDANYLTSNFEEANKWYHELFEMQNVDIDAEYLYRYTQTLKSVGNYSESDRLMKRFKSENPTDDRARRYTDSFDYLEELKLSSNRYELDSLTINSDQSDMAPSFYKEGLVFATARDSGLVTKNIHLWDNSDFRDLYTTEILGDTAHSAPRSFSKMLNLKTEESSTTFTKDGNTVYFTRSNSDDGSFERSNDGISRLKIYRSRLEDEEWTVAEELPFNSDEYSNAHPTLNTDETKLYFSSDRPGGFGSSDIYVVEIDSTESFGAPKNLGNQINTKSRETFPFATEKLLYFASDGYPGLGGLDIYATQIKYLGNENAEVLNLGSPLNSAVDDFGYIIRDETKKGYFVSNRIGGQGNDDIYGFTETRTLEFKNIAAITGVVLEELTNTALDSVLVVIQNEQSELVAEITSDIEGSFKNNTELLDGTYTVLVSEEGYEPFSSTFEVAYGLPTPEIQVVLRKIIEKAEIGQDLAELMDLGKQVHYFDFNKFDILPEAEIVLSRVIDYLNKYSDLKIDIRSHTDAVGDSTYNMWLSSERAKSTAEYLILNGVDDARLTFKGFGETELINICNDWERCTKEQNQLNRRSEFIVVE